MPEQALGIGRTTAVFWTELALPTYSVEKLDSDVGPSSVQLQFESRACRIDRPQSHAKARRRDFDRG
jgi:hypothetical protein